MNKNNRSFLKIYICIPEGFKVRSLSSINHLKYNYCNLQGGWHNGKRLSPSIRGLGLKSSLQWFSAFNPLKIT